MSVPPQNFSTVFEYVAVSPLILECPSCQAEPGIPCAMLDDVVAIIHPERIDAAITIDEAAKARMKVSAVDPYWDE